MAALNRTIVHHKRLVRGSDLALRCAETDCRPAFEQRFFKSSSTKEQPSSQAKQRLAFPQSDRSVLLQSSAWQPRGTDNRIKVLLSEQFINDNDTLGASHWDIICFSFQYAPRGIL
jgi:hypothetical protein